MRSKVGLKLIKINIVMLWDISTESLLEKEMAQSNKIFKVCEQLG